MLSRVEPSRRNFVRGLGAAAAGAALLRHLPGSARAEGLPTSVCPPPSAWSDLAKRVSGGVLRPDDPFFADICRPNNLRYVGTVPAGIARCAKASDVQACIEWVKTLGMEFAVRSGGHNYAGYSTTPGLLIDMSKMQGAEPVPGKEGAVRVLGGTINSLVYKQLERLGRTITHGRCDSVGAAGFLLGGGIGFNMRKFGVASDLLLATDIVTADGRLVPADPDTESGLFWACRGGGGGNFGVNTSFTLQTFPVDTVTVFEITWTKALPQVLYALLRELAAAPDEFGSRIAVSIPTLAQRCQGAGLTLSILGQLHRSRTTLREIFKSTWELAEHREVKEDVPYWQGQDFLTETTYPYYYQEKSSYVKAADISEETVAAMFGWAERMPGSSLPTAFKFFQVGGAIDRTPAAETAYVHRGYDWLFTVEANWWRPSDPVALVEANLDWQQKFYADINRRANAVGAFQNFPDPTLPDWQTAYYGSNLRKLTEVKRAVDPAMLFTFPQAIRPA